MDLVLVGLPGSGKSVVGKRLAHRHGATFIDLDEPSKADGLDQAPVQLDITTKGVKNALSVPVTALVGKSGGGFAVEAVRASGPPPAADGSADWLRGRGRLLATLGSYRWDRPEDRGEWRLVAWSPGPLRGQRVEPVVDRHRGLTLVVAHLRYGPPPDQDAPAYRAITDP